MKILLAPTNKDQHIDAGCNEPTVLVGNPSDGLTALDVIELLVKPAMLAYGYAQESVNEALADASGYEIRDEEEDPE